MSRLRITWKKSASGYPVDQAATIRTLGLRRLHHQVERQDSPVVRGMLRKVRHLVSVEEMEEAPAPARRRRGGQRQPGVPSTEAGAPQA